MHIFGLLKNGRKQVSICKKVNDNSTWIKVKNEFFAESELLIYRINLICINITWSVKEVLIFAT